MLIHVREFSFPIHSARIDEEGKQAGLSRGAGRRQGQRALRLLLRQGPRRLSAYQSPEWCVSGNDGGGTSQRRAGKSNVAGWPAAFRQPLLTAT